MFHRQDCKWTGDASAGTTGREDPTLTIPQVVTLACNVNLSIYILYLFISIYIYMYIEIQKTHVYTHTHMRVLKQIPQPASFQVLVWDILLHQEGWAFCSCSSFWNPLLRLSMVAFVAWPWRSSVLVTRRYPQNQKQWRDSTGSTAGRSQKML